MHIVCPQEILSRCMNARSLEACTNRLSENHCNIGRMAFLEWDATHFSCSCSLVQGDAADTVRCEKTSLNDNNVGLPDGLDDQQSDGVCG